jgi:hypothetical protein
MRKLRLVVILLVVLSLLVAVTASVSAGKPAGKGNNGKAGEKEKPPKKEKEKNKPAPAGHVPPGQAKRQPDMAEATPEPDDDDPTAKVMICHKPGTPAEKTLMLPASAVSGHLQHGDYLGPCLELSPTPSVTPTETITPTLTPTVTVTLTPTATMTPTVTPTATVTPTTTWKIAICHKPNTPAEKTLYLPPPALGGHLGHGDYLGVCISATPTVTPTETVTPTATATEEPTEEPTDEPTEEPTDEPTETPEASAAGAVELLVCHNPYSPDQETLMLAPSAVPLHLAHGDLPGSCDDLPAETWARRLAAAFLRQLANSY